MKIKNYLSHFNHLIKNFFKDFGMIVVLIFSVAALGLGGYNTYLLKSGVIGKPLVKKVDKLTASEIEKMIKNGAAVMGNSQAKVTVIEFADFQCPYCGKYQATIFPTLKEKYIDTGKVRFIYMNYAFLGEESQFASEAAKCAADQGKFWEYHDYLYANQQGENRGAFSVENLKGFASVLKLDSVSFAQCLEGRKYKKSVEEEVKLASRFGVTGTPATFVNDFYISGLQGLSYFENRIESVLNN